MSNKDEINWTKVNLYWAIAVVLVLTMVSMYCYKHDITQEKIRAERDVQIHKLNLIEDEVQKQTVEALRYYFETKK